MSEKLTSTQEVMLASTKAIQTHLKAALQIVEEGFEYAESGQQYALVGGLLSAEQNLEAAMSMLQTIRTLNRITPPQS